MTLRLYAVRDKLAGSIGQQVFMFRADAPAIRFFHDVMSDEKSYPANHPDDYELVCMGAVDEEGYIHAETVPVIVFTGTQWKQARDAAKAASLEVV